MEGRHNFVDDRASCSQICLLFLSMYSLSQFFLSLAFGQPNVDTSLMLSYVCTCQR